MGQRASVVVRYVTPVSPPRSRRWWTQGRAAAPVDGAEDVVKRRGDREQVPVVHRALLELNGELPEDIEPAELPRRRRRSGRNGEHPFHDRDRGASGGGGAGLLPGAVPAGRRAPLRDRPARPRGDLPVAPAARGRGCSPSATTGAVLNRHAVS